MITLEQYREAKKAEQQARIQELPILKSQMDEINRLKAQVEAAETKFKQTALNDPTMKTTSEILKDTKAFMEANPA